MTISICIPAYKKTFFLKRLLDSITIQTFTDFEVIVTDDSPGNEIDNLCRQYQNQFILHYFRNSHPHGTPENWNEAISHANGKWIKLMHDDDWFAGPGSLAEFANAVKQNPSSSFFYSAYINVFENGKEAPIYLNSFRKRRLEKNPASLFSENVIGPPSVTLVKNNKKLWYDNQFKWVVDIDFYIKYLKEESAFYISKPLIKVGVNEEQVTRSAFRVADIEIPENFRLLDKVGIRGLKDMLVYDAFWRMMRNLKITSEAKVRESGYAGELHYVIKAMIKWQAAVPVFILRTWFFSKLIMFIHYLIYRKHLK